MTGLPRKEGEFVLGRNSEIARAAEAPLAGENCNPNLFIVMTTEPTRVLRGMNIQSRLLTFAGASPSIIDEFIATPEGIPLGDTYRTEAMEAVYGRYPAVSAQTSYLRRAVIYSFTRLLVVVDQTRLQGVSRGQFADYIAMVSLADLKPGLRQGDAPTIMKLFEGAPQAAPAGMSEWDQAFLKSLYASEQTLQGQRDQIAHSIVSEVSH